jgi:hypothetical protein
MWRVAWLLLFIVTPLEAQIRPLASPSSVELAIQMEPKRLPRQFEVTFARRKGGYDRLAEEWLSGSPGSECNDPNYQVIIPPLFNLATRMIFLGPNLFLENTGSSDMDWNFPEGMIEDLPDGCRDRREGKRSVKEVLRDAALTLLAEKTLPLLERGARFLFISGLEKEVKIQKSQFEMHIPRGLHVDVDIDPFGSELGIEVEYKF